MKITRRQLRSICEQVVGYHAPQQPQDDYLSMGSEMMSVEPGSDEDTQAMDSDLRKLTKQRQDQLDKGDTIDAEDTGRQLQDLVAKKNESKKIKVTRATIRKIIEETLELDEDVRKVGNKYCAYVDDKLTKKEKENNPKKYKHKKVGSVQKTKSGKIRMKARACYPSKKKANNAMAAAMMG